jgi:hypothetical protein
MMHTDVPKPTVSGLSAGSAPGFAVLPGVVSLPADITYEEARSIAGSYLSRRRLFAAPLFLRAWRRCRG